MQDNGPIGLAHQAHRERLTQFAPLSFMSCAGLQAYLEVMQLRFAHHPREPQE
jgi:hypothetical protein